jgi:hypothetical protein
MSASEESSPSDEFSDEFLMTDSRSFAIIGGSWEGIVVPLSPSFVRASVSQFILDNQPFRPITESREHSLRPDDSPTILSMALSISKEHWAGCETGVPRCSH